MIKITVLGVSKTNEIVKTLSHDKTLLIINVGQTRTSLPEQRQNIIEIDMMMNDIWSNQLKKFIKETYNTDNFEDFFGREKLFGWKINQIKSILEGDLSIFDKIILRCDAGASRSQAIATAFSRYFKKEDIVFENNINVGLLDIVSSSEEVLGIKRNQEVYEKIFDDRMKEISTKFPKMFIKD